MSSIPDVFANVPRSSSFCIPVFVNVCHPFLTFLWIYVLEVLYICQRWSSTPVNVWMHVIYYLYICACHPFLAYLWKCVIQFLFICEGFSSIFKSFVNGGPLTFCTCKCPPSISDISVNVRHLWRYLWTPRAAQVKGLALWNALLFETYHSASYLLPTDIVSRASSYFR